MHKSKIKEQVQSATTLDGVQTVKNSSQTLNTAMKGLRDSIANEATIKAGQNYTDASQIIVTSTTAQLLQQKQSLIKHRTQRWNQILLRKQHHK